MRVLRPVTTAAEEPATETEKGNSTIVAPPAAERPNQVEARLTPLASGATPSPSIPEPDSQPTTSRPATGFASRKEEVNALFANPTLLRIEIEIPRAGLSVLRRGGWGNGQKRPVAKVTVKENGVSYTNVALHLKGAAGSFQPIDERPAMTLNFDSFVPGQKFHGLDKLSLNNSVQDGSFLCEKMAREIFIAAGVPVPRASHALVKLNGRDLGLYVLLEGANKQFLKHYFSNVKGNLYDGGFCQDISPSLAVNCGDNPNDNSGMRALIAAVREPRVSLAQLDQVLDVDRFLSMVAIEIILGHWDGYTLNKNNWRVFHDLDAKKMVFIPHGLDQLFGVGRGQFDPAGSLYPQHVSGAVSRAVLGTREGQRRYREIAARISTNVFKADELTRRVDEITRGLTKQLAETHPQYASLLPRKATWLKAKITQRAEGIARQLGPPPAPVEFTANGILPLSGWKASPSRTGDAALSSAKDENGKLVLKINAGNSGTSSSSWRTSVMLPPGQYRFAGRVRVNGVVADEGDTRAGAHLRISKGELIRHLTGSSDWVPYSYDFVVEEEALSVELICELRAKGGEASFDAASLRLVRTP
ncbi:MAG: CotH kinase family protein [Verrucomicrobiota bacterium]